MGHAQCMSGKVTGQAVFVNCDELFRDPYCNLHCHQHVGTAVTYREETNMRRTLFLSLVCAGVFCIQPITLVRAQVPRGLPSTPPTFPGQNSPNRSPGANEPMDTKAKGEDGKFLKDAALGGMTEVELGKLAVQKASRDDVKQFGQKMVHDHTRANHQLKQIASQENIPVPETLDSKHQSRIDKLSKLSGEDFDKA